MQKFAKPTASDQKVDELALLEQVEERISSWRLSKWEQRVPVLLSQADKEAAQLQLHNVKTVLLDQAKTRALIDSDMNIVCSVLKVSRDELRLKSRSWLQEEIAKLRWAGETASAKSARDAFLRLEQYGSRDFKFFERLCCMYGLAKLGTFDDAFSNFVVPNGNSVALCTTSPFHELMAAIVAKYPTIDIVSDFLGFNELEGYRSSLGRYITEGLRHRHGSDTTIASTAGSTSRVLFQRSAGGSDREILFDYGNSAALVANGDGRHAVADFVHVRGKDITLVSVASKNRWLRSRQQPHRKQLEGIGRRASFVLGIPFNDVRIRSLLLPPLYLDRASLHRVNTHVVGLDSAHAAAFAPWVELYDKELDVEREADFAELTKSKPEEAWVTL